MNFRFITTAFLLATAVILLTGTIYAHTCPVTFTYTPGSQVQTAYVSGTFNNWASAPPQAYEMRDDDGDGTWQVSVEIPLGTYLYKFVIDGVWIDDPSNPERVSDGYGGYNSVLDVSCPYPEFELVTHSTDQAGHRFTATVRLKSWTAELDADSVDVTVDYEAAPSGSVTIANGIITLDISPLSDGIHDVRVDGADVNGKPVETILLKVYINESTDWRDVSMYFTMTDRFNNGDISNDGSIPGAHWKTDYQGGDFRGIINKLEDGYFESLGINALWITWPGDNTENTGLGYYGETDDCNLAPMQPGITWTPIQFTAFHGYWPDDLYETEEHFGFMEELQELVVKAHDRGIRVMLDLVINHVHSDSPYFTGTPYYFFHYPVEICELINWSRPITCWFTEFLPDLNFSDPRVVRDLLNWATWWVKQSGADGFRVDALKHVEWDLITALRSRMHAEMEATGIDFYMVGETFSGNPDDISPFIGTTLVHGQFDFPLNLRILHAFAWEDEGLDSAHGNGGNYFNAYQARGGLMSTFIGNHDISRFVSAAAGSLYCGPWDGNSHIAQGWRNPPGSPTWFGAYQKLQLAFTYIFTLPGIPLIYYGDEIGLPGAGDPDNRRFMKFDTDLSDWEEQTLDYLQLIGTLRRDHPALRVHSWPQVLHSEGAFLVYSRIHSLERAVVALNRSDQQRQQSVYVSGTGLVNGDILTELIRGGTVTVSNNQINVSVPGRGAAIYSKYQTPTPTPIVSPSATFTPTRTPDGSRTPTPVPSGTVGPTMTPTPTSIPRDLTVEVITNQADYQQDDLFWLDVLITNNGTAIVVQLYVVLEAYGSYYFYPSWTPEAAAQVENLKPYWTHNYHILEFIWPPTGFTGEAAFYAGVMQLGAVEFLDIDQTSFTWR